MYKHSVLKLSEKAIDNNKKITNSTYIFIHCTNVIKLIFKMSKLVNCFQCLKKYIITAFTMTVFSDIIKHFCLFFFQHINLHQHFSFKTYVKKNGQ